MANILVHIREVRTGITDIILSDDQGHAYIDGDSIALNVGQTINLTATAQIDGFKDIGWLAPAGGVQRYLGWVELGNTFIFLSDNIVTWRGLDKWDVTSVRGVPCDDLYSGNPITSYSFTITGDGAAHTLEISAMPMLLTASAGNVIDIFVLEKNSGKLSYKSQYCSWNPVAMNLDTQLLEVFICSVLIDSIVAPDKAGHFFQYIDHVTVDGLDYYPIVKYSVQETFYWGTPVFDGTKIVIKGLPYQDVQYGSLAKNFPLFNVGFPGSAYDVIDTWSSGGMLVPVEQGQRASTVTLGGDPHWDYPAEGKKYPRKTIGECHLQYDATYMDATNGLTQITCLDLQNQLVGAAYLQYLAGAITLAQLRAFTTTQDQGIPFYYWAKPNDPNFEAISGVVSTLFTPISKTPFYSAAICPKRASTSAGGTWVWAYSGYGGFCRVQLVDAYVGIDGKIYIDIDNVPTPLLTLYYDVLIGCDASPPNFTKFPSGMPINIQVTNFYPLSITTFTVNGVDHLADLIAVLDKANNVIGQDPPATLDVRKFLQYTIADPTEDQHVVLIAQYVPVDVTPLIPLTIQAHGGCNPSQLWGISSTLPSTAGVTIDQTGLINLTLPRNTATGSAAITVTLDDGYGETTSRSFGIVVEPPPVFGNTWTAMGHVAGTITAMKVLSNDNIIFATDDGKVWLSADGLQTWSVVDTVPQDGSVNYVACFMESSGVVYSFSGAPTTHVRGSSDRGASWAVISDTWYSGQPVYAVDFGSGHFLLIRWQNGNTVYVFLSTDNGANWTGVQGIPYGVSGWWGTPARRAQGDMIVCQGAASGVRNFLSVPPSGDTNTVVTALGSGAANTVIGIFTKHLDSGKWLAFSSDHHAYVSLDDGLTWAIAGNAGDPLYSGICIGEVAIFGGATGWYRSTDDGATINSATGTPDGQVSFLDYRTTDGIIVAATNGGTHNLYRSTS